MSMKGWLWRPKGGGRLLWLLAGLWLLTALGGCGGPTVPAAENLYAFQDFTLSMPEAFDRLTDIESDASAVSFYNREVRSADDGGMLGLLGTVRILHKQDYSRDQLLELSQMTGLRLLGESGGAYYGWQPPTDVQYPPDASAAVKKRHQELSEQLEQIIRSFRMTESRQTDGEAPMPEPDPFALVIRQEPIALKSYDADQLLIELLGTPRSEKAEVLGQDADTFAGSAVKTLVFDGLTVRLFAPAGAGERFWVSEMILTASGIKTASGVGVGTALSELRALQPSLVMVPDGRTDAQNCAYGLSQPEAYKHLTYEVSDGVVKEIRLFVEMP